MTPASCAATAALGLVLGGLVMAGVLLQAVSRPRGTIPGPPDGLTPIGVGTDWTRYDLGDGIQCVIWEARMLSCVFMPPPYRPGWRPLDGR